MKRLLYALSITFGAFLQCSLGLLPAPGAISGSGFRDEVSNIQSHKTVLSSSTSLDCEDTKISTADNDCFDPSKSNMTIGSKLGRPEIGMTIALFASHFSVMAAKCSLPSCTCDLPHYISYRA